MENYVGDINIGGTLFHIRDELLVERDVKLNSLRLRMPEAQCYYLMGYVDQLDGRLFSPFDLSESDMNIGSFRLLKEHLLLDPTNMGVIRRLNAISIEGRMEVVMIDDHMNQRLNGILPRTKFMDLWHPVDLRNRVLTNLNDPKDELAIPDRTAYHGNNYYYYYLKQEHALQAIDLNATHIPQGAVPLEIPVMIDLCDIDPDLRHMSRSPLEKLSSMHLLWDRELRILDINETNLETIFLENPSDLNQDPNLCKGFYVSPPAGENLQQQRRRIAKRNHKGKSVH